MDNRKITNAIHFYMIATKLKDIIRSGWKQWNINRERIESVAEHVYGTCILAIAMDSEFEFDLNLEKSIMMIVLHELEEVIIGDLTPLDNVSREEKRIKGEEAIKEVLSTLTKKDNYIELLKEFEEEKTFEAKFAKMCDKLECDLQIKLYCEEGTVDLYSKDNKHWLEMERIRNRIATEGADTLADLFIGNDRRFFEETESFKEMLEFIKENELLKLK